MLLVTGATGFLGKRVCKNLLNRGLIFEKTSLSMGLDLRDLKATEDFFCSLRPTQVINCAAYVGGIQFGYRHSAEIFHNNLLITLNLLAAARKSGVNRIVNPISNCAYPANAKLFREDEFWNGPLHESVLVYGFARKASWVGALAYQKQYGLDVVNLILSNMYGPQDHFQEERSHALGALIMKIVRAKKENLPKVVVWGSGKPIREWLHVDDGAEALIRGLNISAVLDPINIGIGRGISIWDMALLIKQIVGYEGELELDHSKPDGAPYKTVDGSKGLAIFGWQPNRSFSQGVKNTVNWYLKNGNH